MPPGRETFPQKGLLYHPVKPGVPVWTGETRNQHPGNGESGTGDIR